MGSYRNYISKLDLISGEQVMGFYDVAAFLKMSGDFLAVYALPHHFHYILLSRKNGRVL